MRSLQWRANLLLLVHLTLGPLRAFAGEPAAGPAAPPGLPVLSSAVPLPAEQLAPAGLPAEPPRGERAAILGAPSLSSGARGVPGDPGGPALSDAQLALLTAPLSEHKRRVSRHYLWSNERRHDIFFEDVRELGGGYIGVGADQNYTLAAAAGASMVWLIDLDAAVVSLHQLYGALIATAPSAEEFLALLSGRRGGDVATALASYCKDRREREAALAIYDTYQPLIYRRLRRTYHFLPGGVRATWLNHPEKYEYVRRLVQEGRMVARLGDLNGPRTLQQIGDAARRAGVPVRVIYLSNAESWFHYSPQFQQNLHGLPVDERSVVLRTVKSDVLRYAVGDVWHFSVQRADDFRDKLGLPRYRSIDAIMADLLAEDPPQRSEDRRGLSHISPGVPAALSRDARQGVVTRPSASPSIPEGDTG